MLRSLYAGISGMRDFQTKLDVIGNNIANVNTSGFKASRVNFADIMAQNVQAATAPNGNIGGMNARQIGLGSKISAIDTIFTDGSTQTTNVPTDLAINGSGFFMLRDQAGNTVYTRNGHFTLDQGGNLVGDNGYQVMAVDGTPITVGTSATSFSIDGNGNVSFIDTSGAVQPAAQIGLATFTNPSGLARAGDTTFTATANSGAAVPNPPNSPGYGGITVGALEMSNVDLANEFSDMIVAQRAFQANTRIITISDTILQELVDMKRN
ncbi:MAG: protein of unknown function domain protein [Bacilli bacterium]|nr:protein of unknown function domain protein [Bacilli bacterium]